MCGRSFDGKIEETICRVESTRQCVNSVNQFWEVIRFVNRRRSVHCVKPPTVVSAHVEDIFKEIVIINQESLNPKYPV